MEDLPSHHHHHHHQEGGISPHPVNSYDGMDHVHGHGHGLGDEHLIHHDHGHGEGHHKRGISPLPINSYGGNGHGDGHMIHHHHHGPHGLNGPLILGHEAQELQPYNEKKVVIRYKECLKNHAATMGGNARDGCGEFMPNGEEGTLESLICSACNCHRNFHRKEIEGHTYLPPLLTHRPTGLTRVGSLGYPTPSGAPAPPQQQMRVPYNYNISESDPSYHHHHHHHHVVQKRFRTKFSQEQKEKMLNFAEKIGWRLQKQEEGVVQQFCQEIGVKRRVLKVWMHNNKHNLAKKNNPPTAT